MEGPYYRGVSGREKRVTAVTGYATDEPDDDGWRRLRRAASWTVVEIRAELRYGAAVGSSGHRNHAAARAMVAL